MGMCDDEGELVTWCGNGHKMHATCAQQLATSAYPDNPVCPLCRNSVVGTMIQTVAPQLSSLVCTPYSQMAGLVAVRIGVAEFAKATDGERV